MADIIPFDFEGAQVRVITRAGEPWFVPVDVGKVLEIGNSSQAATRLDVEERGITSNDTPSGPQQMIIINESGLYSLNRIARAEGLNGAQATDVPNT